MRGALLAPLLAGLLVACATSTTPQVPDAPVTNTYWKLGRIGTAVAHVPSGQQREAQITLHLDGQRLTGSGGCNALTGQYVVAGSTLTFTGVVATRRACLEGMEQEQALLNALGKAGGWRIQGDHLWLLDVGGDTLAEFDAVYF
jgi:heat shock protein HslJ